MSFLLIIAAFIIGFLLADRRAVRQMNRQVLEHNARLERFLMGGPLPEGDAQEQHHRLH